MDNSCKQRVYCLYRSFVIVHTERSEWQASLAREKSACLAEVSVTDRFYGNFQKFPEILGELSMRKQCVPGSFFSVHAQEPGNYGRPFVSKLVMTILCKKCSLVPRPPPFFVLRFSFSIYNTRKRKSAKNGEGLGIPIT